MKKVAHIISSPRTAASISRKLGNAVVERIKEKYPDSIVTVQDVAKNPFPQLDETILGSFFTPAEQRSAEQKVINQLSEEAIRMLQEADIIVLETALYNFSITSTLKAYIDFVARAGYTFGYTESGAEGLLKNKKMYVAFSGGAIYSEGMFKAFDFNIPYIKAMFGFLGVTDITVFRTEGLNIPIIQDTALQKGIESIVIA